MYSFFSVVGKLNQVRFSKFLVCNCFISSVRTRVGKHKILLGFGFVVYSLTFIHLKQQIFINYLLGQALF